MKIDKYAQTKLNAARRYMREHKLDGILVTDNVDQLYLTGFFFYAGETIFLIHAKGMAAATRNLYVEPFKKYAPYIDVFGEDDNRARAIVNYAKKLGLKRVGFDFAKESYSTGTFLRKSGCVEMPSLFSKLREAKNEQEIKQLRASNRLAYLTYEYIKPRIKTGMTECEVAAEMEHFMRVHGAKATSFYTIVAFGENTGNPHHETGLRKLKANDAVLIDFGCVYHEYCSDMTRSWWHGKKEPAEYKKIWKIVQKAHDEGIKTAKIGVRCKDVDGAARGVIAKAGYGKYFTHRTGHGVGLDIHESPCNDQTSTHKLEEGNVTSVEPGIYLPGKFGVRLEDLIVITKTGAKILTRK